MDKRGRPRKGEEKKKDDKSKLVMCPICGEAFQSDDEEFLFVKMTFHLFGHIEKKEEDKTKALEKAIKYATLFVDQQTGKILKLNDTIVKDIEEFVNKYGDES